MSDELVIDAWIQHPTRDFLAHPMFASLRRWMGAGEIPAQIPHPMLLPGDCLAQVGELELDEETRKLFLHDNAARVFKV